MYSIGWLPIAIVGMSDKSKPVAVLPTPYWCVSSCGGVNAISPEGGRVYQDLCNSFSMLALQLKVYYISLVATFNQFSLHRRLLYVDTLLKAKHEETMLTEITLLFRLHVFWGNLMSKLSQEMFSFLLLQETLPKGMRCKKFYATLDRLLCYKLKWLSFTPHAPYLQCNWPLSVYRCTHIMRHWQSCASRKWVLFFIKISW